MTDAPRAVQELHKLLFGSPFNQRAWDATRMPKFATRARINALRPSGEQLSEEEYVKARDNYYARYPSAVR